ncbi:hypothetical protein [Plantactinospora sp. KBS50]|uniref:hypothetical protein n=1 Tax=Plantactinospora sp. KBS50 TaxID=2024580 RepID=UPI000BAA9AD7|nr:hypothetical protein [Plantactinospora sp. KBS50]ASW56961.1 hypothetical protein CIK06_26605 [Plantactinospora sp. KBS50]
MDNRTAPAAPRPPAPGIALPLVLAIALLVPVAVLFVQVWRDVDGDRTAAQRERDGIAYLQSLWPVTNALTDAQSAAITGRPVGRAALDRAVGQADAADARWGDELRTRERWTALRARIDALPERATGGIPATLAAYQEVTDLLLALYAKVQDSSGLAREPDVDAANLQDVLARDLPAALVSAGRLSDVIAISAAASDADRLRTVTELAAARLSTFGPANDAVADLQEAVDATQSTDLGSNLLSQLDNYQRAMSALADAAALPAATAAGSTADGDGGTGTADGTGGARAVMPDPAKVAKAREAAQQAASDLGMILLTELDTLVQDRADRTDNRRWLALGAAGLAILLTLAVIVAAVLSARRRAARARIAAVAIATGLADPGAAGDERSSADPPPADQRRWEPVEWAEPVGVGPNVRPAPAAALRDNQPTRWGRTDAAR